MQALDQKNSEFISREQPSQITLTEADCYFNAHLITKGHSY